MVVMRWSPSGFGWSQVTRRYSHLIIDPSAPLTCPPHSHQQERHRNWTSDHWGPIVRCTGTRGWVACLVGRAGSTRPNADRATCRELGWVWFPSRLASQHLRVARPTRPGISALPRAGPIIRQLRRSFEPPGEPRTRRVLGRRACALPGGGASWWTIAAPPPPTACHRRVRERETGRALLARSRRDRII